MDTFRAHLTYAADSLVPNTDPDGAVARHALALAAHAAPSALRVPEMSSTPVTTVSDRTRCT